MDLRSEKNLNQRLETVLLHHNAIRKGLGKKIFEKNLGYNSKFFSYPFGEYSLEQKKYITEKFDYAFGQHSGVIDLNKDKYELPRFPINEKYGDLERFKFLINLLPVQYKIIIPEEKFLLKSNNPPDLIIEFLMINLILIR